MSTSTQTNSRFASRSNEELDNTDIDMLIVRAVLEQRISLEPIVREVFSHLKEIDARMTAFMNLNDVAGTGLSGEQFLREHRKLTLFKRSHASVRGFIKDLERHSELIERGHHNIIRAAKTRVKTRVLQKKCEDVTVFRDLLTRLMVILQEQMPPAYFAALQRRIAHDINELEKHPDWTGA